VESPAGVGWSYSNTPSDYKTGDEHTGIFPYEPLIYLSMLSLLKYHASAKKLTF
jgi:hypothetical protein